MRVVVEAGDDDARFFIDDGGVVVVGNDQLADVFRTEARRFGGYCDKFEVGGFPEDGLFMANHNELVGKFANGNTAVANNEQIVSGIASGVREAVRDELAPYLRSIASTNEVIAEKDIEVSSNGIFKSVRNSARTYKRTTGQEAFSF